MNTTTNNILGMPQWMFDMLTEIHKIRPKKKRPEKVLLREKIKNLKIAVELGYIDGDPFDTQKDHIKELKQAQMRLRMLTAKVKEDDIKKGVTESQIEYARHCDIKYYLNVKADHKAICLFHSDKNASMHVYGSRYYCFACNAHGNVIDIVMKVYGLTFLQAVRKLNNI